MSKLIIWGSDFIGKYIYIYIYIHTHTYVYIYIYICITHTRAKRSRDTAPPIPHRLPNGVKLWVCFILFIYLFLTGSGQTGCFAEVPQYAIIMTEVWHDYGITMGMYGTSTRKNDCPDPVWKPVNSVQGANIGARDYVHARDQTWRQGVLVLLLLLYGYYYYVYIYIYICMYICMYVYIYIYMHAMKFHWSMERERERCTYISHSCHILPFQPIL